MRELAHCRDLYSGLFPEIGTLSFFHELHVLSPFISKFERFITIITKLHLWDYQPPPLSRELLLEIGVIWCKIGSNVPHPRNHGYGGRRVPCRNAPARLAPAFHGRFSLCV